MMRLPRPRETKGRESTIALINVVFLMLIFFLIAGTLAPPIDPDVALIEASEAPPGAPPDALFVTGEGELRARGETTDVETFVAGLKDEGAASGASEAKIAPDRDLPAARLVDIVGELRAAGVGRVTIVTERAAR